MSLPDSHYNKWQKMLDIVNQNPAAIQPNLAWQFKKLFFKRLLTENFLVFFIQYSGLTLSTLSQNSPLWFATGTACAYLFLRGYSILPGIFLGSFLAYFFAKAGFFLSLVCAFVLSLQALLLRWFPYHYLSPTLIFYRLQPFIRFLFYTAALTALMSILLLFLCYPSMEHPKSTLFALWAQWWLANLGAVLLFSCAFVTWDAYFTSLYANPFSKKQLFLSISLIVFIIALAFSEQPITIVCLALFNLLITLTISVQWGWVGTTIAVFLSGILLNFAAFLNAPIFSTTFASSTLFFLQVLLCTESITGFILAIYLAQSRREGHNSLS